MKLPHQTMMVRLLAALSAMALMTSCIPGIVCACSPPITETRLILERGALIRHGYAGYALPDTVVVRVETEHGKPLQGALVTFRAMTNSYAPLTDSVISDASGRARTSWVLEKSEGEQLLLVTLERAGGRYNVYGKSLRVSAWAVRRTVKLRVQFGGDGNGEVIIQPVGVRCDAALTRRCEVAAGEWSTLQLQAIPRIEPRSRFIAWGGSCSAAASCSLVARGDSMTVDAIFALER